MSDSLTQQVIKNTRQLEALAKRKAAAVVCVNGQEFYSRDKGEHNFWLTLGNDMEYVSMFKFKLVIGSGRSSGGETPSDILHGVNLYPTYQDFLAKYPPDTYVDVDGWEGAQCWDFADAFWLGQVGRPLITRPEGKAPVCYSWTESLAANSVGFTIIRNWSDLKPGDWAFWNCGAKFKNGHVAMCYGPSLSNPGEYSFVGQNQGNGIPVEPDGQAVSTKDWGPTDFLGALRYNGWA